MITHYFKTLKDSELKTIDSPRNGVWTHAINPTDEELAVLVEDFSLDETIVEDAKDFFEVPRMERSQGATYFFTRYPFDEKKEAIDTAPLLIIMGESFVLTIALREVPQFENFLNGKVNINTTQKAKLFIQFMDVLTKSYERELTRLRKAVHKNRNKLRKIGPQDIERLVNYENELNNMIAAVVPTNTWLNQVTSGNYMQLYNEDIELMEDLMIANSQLVDSARQVLMTIQNIRSATEAIMTSALNNSIRTLTVLTILLTIPTIISSLYGMNVDLPFFANPFAFWIILAIIFLLVTGTIAVFKRNEWL